MKRELGNKDFIPYRLIKKKRSQSNKGNRGWAIILIIVSAFLLPISIDRIGSKVDEKKESKIVEEPETSYSKESIVEWLEVCIEAEEGEVKEAEGIFIINGNRELEALTMKDNITIKSLEYLGEEKFKVVVIRRNK